jgi:hypothetical protein
MEETATQFRVINEFRKLFQKHDEWRASIYREGKSLTIKLLASHASATWGTSGGMLPFECGALLEELGWETVMDSGTIEGNFLTKQIYPRW